VDQHIFTEILCENFTFFQKQEKRDRKSFALSALQPVMSSRCLKKACLLSPGFREADTPFPAFHDRMKEIVKGHKLFALFL